MIRKLVLLILILLSLGCHAKDDQNIKQNNTGANMQDFMNTQTWKTYCTGRYLIDLPSSMNPEWAGGDDVYGEDISWQKDIVNRQQVLARIEQMKNNLGKFQAADNASDQMPQRKDGRPYLVKQVDYANGGIGILAHDTPSGNGMVLYNYFITANPFRVFYRKVDFVFENNMDEIIAREQKLAQVLRARGEQDIPTGAGICIYGGFIAGQHTDMKENTGIKLNYPYYSRNYYFQIGIGNLVRREPQHVHPKKQKSDYPKIIKVYRDSSSKTVAGLKGMEYVMQRANPWHNDDVPLYNFAWKYAGSGGHNSNDPSISIFMSYVKRDYMKEKDFLEYLMFANENEALALWDKVLQNIRRRPE